MTSGSWFSHYNRKRSMILSLVLGLFVFFNNFTAITPFAETEKPNLQRRYLQSVTDPSEKQTIEFDCKGTTPERFEIATYFETIRIRAENCSGPISFKNDSHRQGLVVFPVQEKLVSSELAYLAKGQNAFTLTTSGKIYRFHVNRL